jgi:hypothetical protein
MLVGIIQLSPLLECDPMVGLPEKSKVTLGWPIVGSHSNKGDNCYIISNIFASDTKLIEYLQLCDRFQVNEYM